MRLFFFFVRYEIHGHRIDAVASVFFCEVLACEDVSEVGFAVCALDFSSPAIRVRQTFYRARNFIIKAWPPAISFKLVL